MFKLFKKQYQESLFKAENDEFYSNINAYKEKGDKLFQKALNTSDKIKAETKAIKELQEKINSSMCFNTK